MNPINNNNKRSLESSSEADPKRQKKERQSHIETLAHNIIEASNSQKELHSQFKSLLDVVTIKDTLPKDLLKKIVGIFKKNVDSSPDLQKLSLPFEICFSYQAVCLNDEELIQFLNPGMHALEAAFLYAIENQDEETLDKLLGKGVNINNPNIANTGQTPLNFSITSQFPIALLLKKGADAKEEGLLYLAIANYYDLEILELLIAQGANVNEIIDEYTPLRSLIESSGSKKYVKAVMELLFKNGADPTIKTRKTAFERLEDSEEDLAHYFPHFSCFEGWNSYLKGEWDGTKASSFISVLTNFPEMLFNKFDSQEANPLEVAFAVGHESLARSIFSVYPSEQEAFKDLQRLQSKYEKANTSWLYAQMWGINETHLRLNPEPFPEEVALTIHIVEKEAIDPLFQKITAVDPNSPFYLDLSAVHYDSGESTSIEGLKNDIVTLAHRIKDRIPYTGTPKKGTLELECFYGNLERKFLECLFMMGLDRIKPETLLTAFQEIAIAGHYCGVRWKQGLYQAHRLLKRELYSNDSKELSFEERALEQLRLFRNTLFSKIGHELNPADTVHIRNFFLKEIGAKWGIEDADAADIDPTYVIKDKDRKNKEIFEKKLKEGYTSNTILRFISSTFSNDWINLFPFPKDWQPSEESLKYYRDLLYLDSEDELILSPSQIQDLYMKELIIHPHLKQIRVELLAPMIKPTVFRSIWDKKSEFCAIINI